jgi:hypothetical protein
MNEWRELIELTEAVADAGDDMPEAEFEALSDRRLDALDDVMELPGPRGEIIRALVGAGIDLRPSLIRAVAGL